MAAFGIDAAPGDIFSGQSEKTGPYELHADVAEVFVLFQQCQGSWRTSFTGGLLGLVKSDVAAVAGAMDIKLDREAFSLLTVCETEFIRLYNRRKPTRGRRT